MRGRTQGFTSLIFAEDGCLSFLKIVRPAVQPLDSVRCKLPFLLARLILILCWIRRGHHSMFHACSKRDGFLGIIKTSHLYDHNDITLPWDAAVPSPPLVPLFYKCLSRCVLARVSRRQRSFLGGMKLLAVPHIQNS